MREIKWCAYCGKREGTRRCEGNNNRDGCWFYHPDAGTMSKKELEARQQWRMCVKCIDFECRECGSHYCPNCDDDRNLCDDCQSTYCASCIAKGALERGYCETCRVNHVSEVSDEEEDDDI